MTVWVNCRMHSISKSSVAVTPRIFEQSHSQNRQPIYLLPFQHQQEEIQTMCVIYT